MSASCRAMTMPPTLSMWTLSYFVVLWSTSSAHSSIGRCSAGLSKGLSTTAAGRATAMAPCGDVGQAQDRWFRLDEEHPRVGLTAC
jgi:hypothetical protein